MQELELMVPTYYGQRNFKLGAADDAPDFGTPLIPVLVREAEGVRIVLGTLDFDDCETPDIQIERRPNGWAIFLHPLGGSDPSGYVYFHDDGRSFLLKESGGGPTEPITVLESGEGIPSEVDGLGQLDSDQPSFILRANDPPT